jgi:peptidoglycan/LPS O-acetylase OafA/YrhL
MSEHASAKIDAILPMRGIAALVVVCWHASRYSAPYSTGWSGALCLATKSSTSSRSDQWFAFRAST